MIKTTGREVFSLPVVGPAEEPKTRVAAEKGVLVVGPRFFWTAGGSCTNEGIRRDGLYVQPFPGPDARRQIAPSSWKPV
jgi:hypothetical protein